ncbi:membrane protein, partial [Achromobacter xylosoxidans]
GYVPTGRVGFYTVSFFLLWGMAGASSALTAYLMPKVEEDPDL